MRGDSDITEQLLPRGAKMCEENTAELKEQKLGALPRVDETQYATNQLQLAAWLISLSSFLWGFSTSVLNVCIVPDAKGSMIIDIYLTTEEQETATSLVLVGAVFSALLTSRMNERIGHKRMLLLSNVFYLVGGGICALAVGKRSIYLGRFCIGIACGVVTNTVPILLSEISPAHCRGRITTYHQLNLTLGILSSGVLGFFVIEDVPSGWRYLNGFLMIPPVLQWVTATLIPESPWWLMKYKGRDESRAALVYLRSNASRDDIDAELSEISTEMESRSVRSDVHWCDLLKYKGPLLLGSLLVFFQAMTGINTVMYYSAKIFHFAGVTNPFIATAAVQLTNVLVTVLSVTLVDSYGRRPLLLCGVFLMVIALAALSLSLLQLESHSTAQGVLAVGSVLVFVGGFAIGLGSVVWVILAEITPVNIRSRAFTVYMGISYFCNIMIAVYTLTVIDFLGGHNKEKIGIAKLYLIGCGVSAICYAFVFIFVKETKYSRPTPRPSEPQANGTETNGLLAPEKDIDNSNITEL